MSELLEKKASITYIPTKEEILQDYRLACESREASLLGRKDVFMGRAKFGIFGTGKELAQIAMAKFFRKGDFRSGYYRDQTFSAAIGGLTWQQLFSQLYAHADLEYDVFSGGRSMNAHYCNRWLDKDGEWLDQTELFNSVMDVSSTAGQIPRAVGLAYASKLYRRNKSLKNWAKFSKQGNEVCFATIGDASTSQGMFFEAINAAGVLQIPVIFSVWDDGYGISVPKQYQTTKESISEILMGFQRTKEKQGLEIIRVKGYDYEGLIAAYQLAARLARDQHIPCLVHVEDMTQQQGHSSSGSHERYKTPERLQWEKEHDCNLHFKRWILSKSFATELELEKIEEDALKKVKAQRDVAWKASRSSFEENKTKAISILEKALLKSQNKDALTAIKLSLQKNQNTQAKDIVAALKASLVEIRMENNPFKTEIKSFLKEYQSKNDYSYSSHLYSEGKHSPLRIKKVPAKTSKSSRILNGHQVINSYFDALLAARPEVFAIGEDVGKIGDVNQGFAGLQDKYGELRITDTGIREATIIGQGIGAAMRGLRPIVEVQYFDYVYYCLHVLTDDLACLRYRSFGQQKAPLIVRTRGHRLEGIWHSGSPMAVMIHALRGMHVLVPRNFVQAAALYNTLLDGDDPALLVEPLNSYRQKETLPENLLEMREPLGKIDFLKSGTDITLVTYGSMCRIVLEAAEQLHKIGIDVEVIDVQTLLPFDREQEILQSIKKTNRVLFIDEDMPGGGTAYMLQQVVDEMGAYRHLDSAPQCLSAKAHRPAYGSDGDYFSKPNTEDIVEKVYGIMREANPARFPEI